MFFDLFFAFYKLGTSPNMPDFFSFFCFFFFWLGGFSDSVCKILLMLSYTFGYLFNAFEYAFEVPVYEFTSIFFYSKIDE